MTTPSATFNNALQGMKSAYGRSVTERGINEILKGPGIRPSLKKHLENLIATPNALKMPRDLQPILRFVYDEHKELRSLYAKDGVLEAARKGHDLNGKPWTYSEFIENANKIYTKEFVNAQIRAYQNKEKPSLKIRMALQAWKQTPNTMYGPTRFAKIFNTFTTDWLREQRLKRQDQQQPELKQVDRKDNRSKPQSRQRVITGQTSQSIQIHSHKKQSSNCCPTATTLMVGAVAAAAFALYVNS